MLAPDGWGVELTNQYNTVLFIYPMDSQNQVNASHYATKLEERVVFLLVAMGVLTLTYGFLFAIDFIPEKSDEAEAIAPADTAQLNIHEEDMQAAVAVDPYPMRIIFDTLDEKTLTVLNPESHTIEALDQALLSGVVRHPDSADFEDVGTIFLFGHSSYLPKVINKNFQAFNGIQKLKWGDTVRLQSSDMEYVYRVDTVKEVSALDAEVEIEMGTPRLTLVTCDSFGSKSDRFIVEATLIKSYALTSKEDEEGSS
jgi:LPXTG-site transpeptidase (sortase) family protein